MDNNSGALILLIVLIVSAFLLIVIKLAQFVNRFNREKQCLLTEMNRAAESKSSGPQGPLLFCTCGKIAPGVPPAAGTGDGRYFTLGTTPRITSGSAPVLTTLWL